MSTTPPDLVLFLGRLHPLLVHLPIGFLLLLVLIEALACVPRFKHANVNAGIILALAVPASLLAVTFGWLLSLGGGYQERLLALHKWTGIGVAGLCLVAALLYWLQLKRSYRGTLIVGVVLLFVSTHYGGSLTHGSDYLAQYAPGPLRVWLGGTPRRPPPVATTKPAPEAADVFAALVQPVLQQNCVSCHGPEKSKGGLRVDTVSAMLEGGDSGPAVVPGKPGESMLVKRVRLPLSHEEHMPPEGKPQPSADDLALVEWWIQTGAATNRPIRDFKAPPVISRILQVRLGIASAIPKEVPPKPLEQVLPLAVKLGDELGVLIAPIAPGEPWLQCNATPAGTNFTDLQLVALAPIGSNLRWLDLAGTAFGDTGASALAQMPNLTRLHLERTAITDAGLAHVAGLSQLEYLNLHHTAVTEVGLSALLPLGKLAQLYLWGTKVSPEAARSFADSRIDKEQIEKWQAEIELLTDKIRRANVMVDTGVQPAAATTNSLPVNTTCPVSGKAADPAMTLSHDGRVVAFCCGDCRNTFQQDPKAYLDKIPPLMPKEAEKTASK